MAPHFLGLSSLSNSRAAKSVESTIHSLMEASSLEVDLSELQELLQVNYTFPVGFDLVNSFLQCLASAFQMVSCRVPCLLSLLILLHSRN